jgi:tryptophan-rich sensory protein
MARVVVYRPIRVHGGAQTAASEREGAWSWIFFGFEALGLAFLEIIALWLLIAATIVAFLRHDRVAAWLLMPYLLWVTYAGALNFSLWRLNT